jgi:hypothetical protein
MKQRKVAWETEGELTKHGLLEYDEVFRGIDCLDSNILIVEKELYFECSVRRNVGKNKSVGNVVVAKEPIRELYFGMCTCGVDTQRSAMSAYGGRGHELPYPPADPKQHHAVLVAIRSLETTISTRSSCGVQCFNGNYTG